MPRAIDDDAFKAELTALIPQMRAFARSLCRTGDGGDDLAQDALVKAWQARASFEPGTNLKAWTFMIVRNQFYSDKRRSWRERPLDQETAERTLVFFDDPISTLALDEVRRALAMLPADQREALILVGAGGLAYDEAAAVLGCALGTIKSRVSRGRDRLAALLAEGGLASDRVAPGAALPAILSDLDALQASAA